MTSPTSWLHVHKDPSQYDHEWTYDWECLDCHAMTRYPTALTRPSDIGCWRCGMQLSAKTLAFADKRVQMFVPSVSP